MKRSLKASVPVISLRAEDSLRDKLQTAARDGSRSLSQECERRLEASFNSPPVTLDDVRTLIREEIRAALVEAAAMPDLSDFREPMVPYQASVIGGQLLKCATQTYDRSALMGRAGPALQG